MTRLWLQHTDFRLVKLDFACIELGAHPGTMHMHIIEQEWIDRVHTQVGEVDKLLGR